MSKQDELQYEQQEKRIQAQSDAFITLLTKRGILGDSQIDDTENSHDSRYWDNPFVPYESVIAKLLLPVG